jgi:cytochrome c oxidase subunit I+III
MAATIGAGILGLAVLSFIINVLWSRKHGLIAGPNPWNAGTLEWAIESPPPDYNFLYPPTVRSRYPLWEDAADTPVITGLSLDEREVLITTTHDAIPNHRYHMASDSIKPTAMAVATGGALIGFIFHPLAFPIGVGVVLLLVTIWLWPTRETKPLKNSHRRRTMPEQLSSSGSEV